MMKNQFLTIINISENTIYWPAHWLNTYNFPINESTSQKERGMH